MKYRKKPVIIEAIKYHGPPDGWFSIKQFAGDNLILDKDLIAIKTLEGIMKIDSGDWVIKGVKGEFYPCKPDIFESTYEETN